MLPTTPITTDRLVLYPLEMQDATFLSELVNTPGWLRFIGERNVHTPEEAIAYVQKLMLNASLQYKVVRLKSNGTALGIITFIKRAYLDYPDIGFAFLPEYSKQGYAYEASKAVLGEIAQHHSYTHILATTIPENTSSIRLLEKLGLRFDRAIQVESLDLHVYSMALEMFKKSYT
jgi:ribosomal-protein-alanine N-acetyltransferase